MAEYGAEIETGVSTQEIPYPYVDRAGLRRSRARTCPQPSLRAIFRRPGCRPPGRRTGGWPVAAQGWEAYPLALFDALRTDFSRPARPLHRQRLAPRSAVDPADQLPHRYVDQFVQWGREQVARGGSFERLVLPGTIAVGRQHFAAGGRGAGGKLALAPLPDARLPSDGGGPIPASR